ncbi:MAG TPA: ankyrin repeat domain-containing protein, partial [Gemmatimonadaceae bacterium]
MIRALLLGSTLVAAVTATSVDPSPVADAAERGDTALVRSLIRKHANVNAPQGDGMTALHWAARHGDANEVKLLLGAGAKIEAGTRNGSYTPLQLAAREGRAAATK